MFLGTIITKGGQSLNRNRKNLHIRVCKPSTNRRNGLRGVAVGALNIPGMVEKSITVLYFAFDVN